MITIKEEFVGCTKVLRAIELGGWQVVGLWLALKAYAAENLTDGFVPDEAIVKLRGAPKNARKYLRPLVECGSLKPDGSRGNGLLDPHPHGWQLHDYLDHANSAEHEKDRRRKERDRKAAYRAGKGQAVPPSVPAIVPRDKSRDNGTSVPPVPGSVPDGTRPRARIRTPAGVNPNPAQPTLSEREARAPEEVRPERPDGFANSFRPSGDVERYAFEAWARAWGMTGATYDARRAACLMERVRAGMTTQDADDAIAGAMADEWITGIKDGQPKRRLTAIFGDADSFESFRHAGQELRERPTGVRRSVAQRVADAEAATNADRAKRGLPPVTRDEDCVTDPKAIAEAMGAGRG